MYPTLGVTLRVTVSPFAYHPFPDAMPLLASASANDMTTLWSALISPPVPTVDAASSLSKAVATSVSEEASVIVSATTIAFRKASIEAVVYCTSAYFPSLKFCLTLVISFPSCSNVLKSSLQTSHLPSKSSSVCSA